MSVNIFSKINLILGDYAEKILIEIDVPYIFYSERQA
jgi:hypothetical protein